ncbi:MAG: hypothetical protein HY331_08145 [Chloroflexi bacterium]|nr:hypothetical protein [Chloroflexota bacterium]
MYRTLIAVAVAFSVVLAGLATPSANAQDFNGLVRSALSANVQLVQQIRQALDADDLSTVKVQARVAAGTAEQVESLLAEALGVAPDDPSRSRVEGVLIHIRAALNALRLVGQETTLDGARSRLNQARGEAEEALAELRPFAEALPAPQEAAPAPETLAPTGLPRAGSLSGRALMSIAGLGAALVLAGLRLRRCLAATA